MRILIPTADFPPIEGGISTVAYQTARELAAEGHEITVVAPYFPGQKERDRKEPMRVVRYRGYWLGPLRLAPMLVVCLRFLYRTHLVLAINIAYGGVIGWIGRRVFYKPYVTFAYAYEFLKYSAAPIRRRVLRSLYLRSRVVIAISNYTRKRLIAFGVPTSEVETVYPGAPPVDTPTGPADATTDSHLFKTVHLILSVGRFIPRKGHLALIRAMPRVLEEFPDAVLVLAGRGPTLYECVQEARALDIRDHVLFPGKLSDERLRRLFDACELFALPTGTGENGQVEGFGLVFAEAHAHGKPVVAGESGGVAEVVLDGQTGFVVDPQDIDALADRILRLMRDPKLARRMGEAGRRRVEQELNWTEFTRRLLSAVEDHR